MGIDYYKHKYLKYKSKYLALKGGNPPKHVIDYWAQESNWAKRYVMGSWPVNMYLCGVKDKVDWKSTIWTP